MGEGVYINKLDHEKRRENGRNKRQPFKVVLDLIPIINVPRESKVAKEGKERKQMEIG